MQKQQLEKEKFIKPLEAMVPQVKYILKKLPLWGRDNDIVPDFEWPSQEDFEKMAPEVSVSSIEFKTKPGMVGIAFVQFQLTNGESSPAFQTAGIKPTDQYTVSLFP